MNATLLDQMAALFTYPQGGERDVLASARSAETHLSSGELRLESGDPAASDRKQPAESLPHLDQSSPYLNSQFSTLHSEFAKAMADLTLEERQELYVRTFEMNPVCSLEVGWQLYGEHYERGTFLVRMRQAMRQLELTESAELPDHLTHVLEILGRMPEPERSVFAAETLRPAVKKMHAALRETDNPYRHLLLATHEMIDAVAANAPQEVHHER